MRKYPQNWSLLDLSHSEISSIEDAKDGRVCTASPKFVTIITPSPYFDQDQDLRKRSHQIEYQDQSGDHEGIVAKKEKIRMIVGFPSVQITKKGKCFYMLLPSLTREMVTADIAAARHAPAADQPRIDYFLSE